MRKPVMEISAVDFDELVVEEDETVVTNNTREASMRTPDAPSTHDETCKS